MCWVACNVLVKVLAAFYCVHLLHKKELKDRGGIRKCLYSSIIVSVLNNQPLFCPYSRQQVTEQSFRCLKTNHSKKAEPHGPTHKYPSAPSECDFLHNANFI